MPIHLPSFGAGIVLSCWLLKRVTGTGYGYNDIQAHACKHANNMQLPCHKWVQSYMGSLAYHPGSLQGTLARQRRRGAAMRSASRKPAAQDPVDYSAISDAEVMLLAGKGDDAAYNYLVEKFHRPICGFLNRMVRVQAVAEELTQEVFLRVYRSRATYAAEAKFTTWLYRIATNLAVNHARDTRIERTTPTVNLDEPDPESGSTVDVADKSLSVEQRLVRQERMAAIRKHVMDLPERQRIAVLMHKYQELDYREIAAVLKLSESATKSLLFRAYETLREKLKGFL